MNYVLSEKEYQAYILEKLKGIGYEIWPSSHYDKNFAVDREELFRFLYATQPDTMKALNKIYRSETEETIVSAINTEETKKRGSRLSVLKHGIELSNLHLDLMYSKPATTFNKELNVLYEKNIFSASEEVWASDKERIDIVIYLNGLAIMTFELKANTAGQNYHDAIYQYRTERNPKTRLFRFKAGALVCFAMDLEEVYMTTKLDGAATFFLPFNMGRGEGINTGAGNPILEDEFSVHYMWDNILQKDSIIEIITKFMFIEVKEKEDEETGKKKITETVIFPRFHQLDVLRKLLDDVKEKRTSQNYLLQHSAGSGKTNEIAWLSHRLASLHDDDNKIIFDNIIICTDRVVVDRQLQQAVKSLEHNLTVGNNTVRPVQITAFDGNGNLVLTGFNFETCHRIGSIGQFGTCGNNHMHCTVSHTKIQAVVENIFAPFDCHRGRFSLENRFLFRLSDRSFFGVLLVFRFFKRFSEHFHIVLYLCIFVEIVMIDRRTSGNRQIRV